MRLRQTAGKWQIADWERDLVRSELDAWFVSRPELQDRPGLANIAGAECLQRWKDSLDDGDARMVVFALLRFDDKISERADKIAERCAHKGSMSAARAPTSGDAGLA